MKYRKAFSTLLCAGILAGCVIGCATEKEHEAKLAAEARISRADAEKTALAKVPNGTIKEGELEKEKGKLIWSFDISVPDSKDIKEVNVDAITGDVVGIETETPAQQAKEAAEDAKKEKKERD